MSEADRGLGKFGFPIALILKIAGVALASLAALWLLDKLALYWLSRSYVDQIAETLDLNRHLAKAIQLAVFGAIAFFGALVVSFSGSRRRAGFAGLLGLLIANSLVLWWGTSQHLFARSGEAIKCYVMTRDGVRYGERPGIDPISGKPCHLVTTELVDRLRAYERGKRPSPISAADTEFFSPLTGEAVAWHYTSSDGSIELYDLMGFHPATGEELSPVTRAIVQKWQAQAVDRRNREAERNRRPPQRVDPEKYPFFDPVHGTARVYYWKSGAAEFEFYDGKGFHPRTGDELTLITKEAIADWQKAEADRLRAEQQEKEKRAAKRIDPESYAFFDPITGQPRVWYWRTASGEYEFFDRSGYHPRTGDELIVVTREIIAEWRRSLDLLKKKKDEQEGARRAEQDRERAAPSLCDSLAANPTDPRKPRDIAGTSFDALRASAAEAITACEIATNQAPQNLRYRYQLARAYQAALLTDQRAHDLFRALTEAGYPAAHDNLAGTIFARTRDYEAAVSILRRGAALNDPDSMVTLAQWIDGDRVSAINDTEQYTLVSRAAQLGHPGAILWMPKLQQERSARNIKRHQDKKAKEAIEDILRRIPGGLR